MASGPAKRVQLAERRKALGLTQEQLAELLAVERTTVARWERGEAQPQPWLRSRLAKALQISADRLEQLLATEDADGPSSNPPLLLPAAVADFTGRVAELAALTAMLDQAGAGAPGTVAISVISGTAGVGKTALALHWAHGVAARFPDGQLHLNLRGFDPSGALATPGEAIRGFLDALGVPPGQMPPTEEAQAGLYRSLLAARKMLVVLDNARDEQQVRPLLPPSPGSLVLVTSRHQLGGLAAADGARLLSLQVPSHADAVQMLTARLGTERAVDPGALDEIASLCALLPLGLAVAAARAAAVPAFPLAALADELRDVTGRLDALDAGDPGSSVRAVFSWSTRQLTADTARMFRLLGIHPGPDISVRAAASLAGIAEADARRLLRELARAHLIAEHVPGRYAFHDLLRAHAAEEASTGTEPDRDAAVSRVLDHYLHTAHAAAGLINPARHPIPLPAPACGVTPECLADQQQALAWFGTEHQVLLAAITLADSAGFGVHAWQIPWTMVDYLNRRGHWHEMAAILRTARAATERLGDTTGQAMAVRLLAGACWRLGDDDQALAHYAAALRLYQQLGDPLGEATVYNNLGGLAERQGRYTDALSHAEQALRLYQEDGFRPGEARMLNNVGWCHALLGDYQQTRTFCRQALSLCAEVGYRRLEGDAWDTLGYAEHHLGNYAEAAVCYQRALSLLRESGDRRFEAESLTHLGDTCEAAGQLVKARDAWQQALAILDDLGAPEADHVRAKLASADGCPGKRTVDMPTLGITPS